MRKLFAFLSVVAVVLAMAVTPAFGDENGNGGNGGGRCSNPNAAAKNPHCNGGKPGGKPYKGNGCPSFLAALNMCTRPGGGNGGNGNGNGNGNGRGRGNSQSQQQQQSQSQDQGQRQCVLVLGVLQPANC